MQEVERPLGPHAVAPLEELDLGPVGQAELRVQPPHFGVFVGHPVVAPHEVQVPALDHERAREPWTCRPELRFACSDSMKE